MNIRRVLSALVRVIADEAEQNPYFAAKLKKTLASEIPQKAAFSLGVRPPADAAPTSKKGAAKRAAHRRTPAVLDPIHIARQGEAALRLELSRLTLDQLLDIVAEFGMDPGKLVMKWKTPARVIDRIAEMSLARAHKGSAFREQEPGEQ